MTTNHENLAKYMKQTHISPPPVVSSPTPTPTSLHNVIKKEKEYSSLKQQELEIIEDKPKSKYVRNFFQNYIDDISEKLEQEEEDNE